MYAYVSIIIPLVFYLFFGFYKIIICSYQFQSMNFIAAITLLFLKEELAFWSIVQLIDSDYSHKKINISG